MSDSITVRVMLGSYDVVHPAEKQTQVYVQIPEVARAIWLLDEEMYSVLANRPWPKVVESAEECYVQRGTVSDSVSDSSRAAVVKWLRDDANHDLMYEAWEQDQARQHPVARKLLDRVTELEAQRDRRRVRLIAAEADLLAVRGMLSPAGEARRIPDGIEIHERVAPAVEWLLNRVAELEAERHSTNEALSEAAEALRESRDRIAELEAAPTTVFRASHDSIVMGLYTTREAAMHHCEAHELRDDPVSPMSWRTDEDGVADLVRERVPRSPSAESVTGYVVTPLEVASEYDEEADE
ncbi:hypothetical protein [Streptomyces flaveolus]|uniref:hypothetical protein n=1 Tax=Streptomyces flaveolus TaxID=67297 RepID=UPI00340FA2B3